MCKEFPTRSECLLHAVVQFTPDCRQAECGVGEFVGAGAALAQHTAVKVDDVGVSKVGVDQVTPSHVGDSHVAVVLHQQAGRQAGGQAARQVGALASSGSQLCGNSIAGRAHPAGGCRRWSLVEDTSTAACASLQGDLFPQAPATQ